MSINLQSATPGDVPALAALHAAVAEHLTSLHGPGQWSDSISEKRILLAMRNMHVYVARQGPEIIATFHLATKKPWAIDRSYFAHCQKPLYLLSMAVIPARQRQGIGCQCLDEAKRIAKAWPADAIRLDAYDTKAGAGSFYVRCGYAEVGRGIYRKVPMIYYELLLA